MKFIVSRQYYFYSGEYIVEIAYPSIDYTGPDMLVERYPEEGEYSDPREALDAAIAIQKAWQADCPEESIGITFGHFDSIEGEPEEIKNLRTEIEKFYQELPKCDQCGKLLDENRTCMLWDDPDMGRYCSEQCAENALQEMVEDV
jgi:hypothetical protein